MLILFIGGWLAGWLAGCLPGWLAGWLAAWLPSLHRTSCIREPTP